MARSLPATTACLLSAALFCAAAPAQPASGPAAPASLRSLTWLAGCWASAGGEPGSGEQWMAPAGDTLLGMSRTVRQGRTVAHEFMQIRAGEDGRVAFIAQPSGQALTRFPLLRLGDNEVVFENLAHDFPQRVIYASDDGQRLRARIEGQVQGTLRAVDFPMQRVSCEAAVR